MLHSIKAVMKLRALFLLGFMLSNMCGEFYWFFVIYFFYIFIILAF